MIVGITSQNFRSITGHAGKTRRFLVYAVSDNGTWHEQQRLDLPKDMSLHEYQGEDHPVYQFDLLVTAGCGDNFLRRMQQHGVDVLATSETDPLTALQKVIRQQALPPPAANDHGHH
jgi:predicted Fe-Mo cluster-binding NifX family protein